MYPACHEVTQGGTMNIRQTIVQAIGLLLLAASLLGNLEPTVKIYFAASSVVLCGWPVLHLACAALLNKRADGSLLIVFSTVGLISIGKLLDAAVFMAIIAGFGTLQAGGAEYMRRALYNAWPTYDRTMEVLADDLPQMVSCEQIGPGDAVILKQTQILPVDAIVKDGEAELAATPFPAGSTRHGEFLFAGSRIGRGQLLLESVSTKKDALLHQALAANKRAVTEQEHAARILYSQEYARRLLTFIFFMAIPYYFFADSMINWIYYTLTLLLIFAPYDAIIKLTSLLFSLALDKAVRLGGIVLRPNSLEDTGRINAIAFEKNTALSTGELIMTNIYAPYPFTREQLTRLATVFAIRAAHPLSAAISKYAGKDVSFEDTAVAITEQEGFNLAGQVAGQQVLLGSNAFVSARGIKTGRLLRKYSEYLAHGSIVLFIVVDGEAAGLLSFIDDIHPEMFSAIKKIRLLGLKNIIMLTKDQEKAAAASGKPLGFTRIMSNIARDAQSSVAIKQLRYDYGSVLVVGDAQINSAALDSADVSVAVDVCSNLSEAKENADIVLISDHRRYLADLFAVSRRYLKALTISKRLYILTKFVLFALVIFNFLYIWQALILDGLIGFGMLLSAHRLLSV